MTRSIRIGLAGAIALLVIGMGGLAALLLVPSPPPTTNSMVGALGGPFMLTATDGRTVTDQTYRGKWVLIYFGYASCAGACPTALNNMGVALDRPGPEAAKLQPIFITVDPKRDTQKALAEYLKSFDPHIVALTGSEEQIAAVVKEYRVYVEVQPGNGGDHIINHTSFYYLINPEGKFVRVIAGDVSGEELAERLRHWMNKTPLGQATVRFDQVRPRHSRARLPERHAGLHCRGAALLPRKPAAGALLLLAGFAAILLETLIYVAAVEGCRHRDTEPGAGCRLRSGREELSTG